MTHLRVELRSQGTFSPKSDEECLGWPSIKADYAGLWRSPPNNPLSFHWSELAWMNDTTKAVYPGFPTSGCRVHPSIVDLGEGHLKVFFRDRRMENIYVADSFDNGMQLQSSLRMMIIRIPRSCSTSIVYAVPHNAQRCLRL